MPQDVNERPCFSGTVRVTSLKLRRLFTRIAWCNMVHKLKDFDIDCDVCHNLCYFHTFVERFSVK